MNAETIKDTPKIQHTKAWPAGLVSVCGYCYPQLSLFTDYPWLTGLQISHGICKEHLRIELTKQGILVK